MNSINKNYFGALCVVVLLILFLIVFFESRITKLENQTQEQQGRLESQTVLVGELYKRMNKSHKRNIDEKNIYKRMAESLKEMHEIIEGHLE